MIGTYPEYGSDELAGVPIFWHRLVDEQAIIAAVIESQEPRTYATSVAFGASVFVSDAVMVEARVTRRVTKCLIRRELSQKDSTNLRRNAIAGANAGAGLNAIIIHAAASQVAPTRSTPAVSFIVREAFGWAPRG